MLSVIEMACTVPISIFSVYISGTSVPIEQWVSLSDTHFNFSHVGLIPATEWTSNSIYKKSIDMTQWLFPVCALLFFALFGFANEARKHYRLAFLWISKHFGYNPTVTQTLGSNVPRLAPTIFSMADYSNTHVDGKALSSPLETSLLVHYRFISPLPLLRPYAGRHLTRSSISRASTLIETSRRMLNYRYRCLHTPEKNLRGASRL